MISELIRYIDLWKYQVFFFFFLSSGGWAKLYEQHTSADYSMLEKKRRKQGKLALSTIPAHRYKEQA